MIKMHHSHCPVCGDRTVLECSEHRTQVYCCGHSIGKLRSCYMLITTYYSSEFLEEFHFDDMNVSNELHECYVYFGTSSMQLMNYVFTGKECLETIKLMC